MAVLPIITYPNPVLSQKTKRVSNFDRSLHTLLDNMFETMYRGRGVGLAAPQVSSELRVTVVDISEDRSEKIELINPEIVEHTGKVKSEEGCLSIPGYRDFVERSKIIRVLAFDRHGKSFELQAEGLLSMCLQHEIDHLDGVLFVDRLSRLKKELFKKWIAKRSAQGEYP